MQSETCGCHYSQMLVNGDDDATIISIALHQYTDSPYWDESLISVTNNPVYIISNMDIELI